MTTPLCQRCQIDESRVALAEAELGRLARVAARSRHGVSDEMKQRIVDAKARVKSERELRDEPHECDERKREVRIGKALGGKTARRW